MPATSASQDVLEAFLKRRSKNTIAAYRRDLADFARFLRLEPGDNAPVFTLLDLNGEPFSLSKSLNAP